MSPIETNDENPMPRVAAASIAAIANPLLWEAKPTCPGEGARGATVALSAISGRGFATPRQFGPSMRIPAARQTASRSSTSVKPCVSTTRARTRLAAQARAASMTAAAGTASTASSTSPSISASAPTSSTRCSGRVKPPARRLRATSAPGGSDAPITATEAGRRTCATAATPALRWRASKRCRASRDSDVGNSRCTSPSDRCADDREAGVVEHPEHAAVLRQDRRGERGDAFGRGGMREVGEQHRRDPVSMPGVGHREGDLRTVRRLAEERGVRDDRALTQRDQRQPVVRRPRRCGQPSRGSHPR